ncbi:MAG: hypothetical protein U0892_09325 [Pirellulales bacterium]
MNILQWISLRRPGRIQDMGDRIEIFHESGEHSTLWKRLDESYPRALKKLGQVYSEFDGMDLFSSTFKIASSSNPKAKNGVTIAFTLGQLQKEISSSGCEFPSDSVPFMYQAGIGYGALEVSTGAIYECESDGGPPSDKYISLEELMDDWLAAVS